MKNEIFLYNDSFEDLDNWHLEGTKAVSIPSKGTMRLTCERSRQGKEGCMAFCKLDFPDQIAIEYDLYVSKSDGLVITFLAMRGLNGQDIIKDLPPRKGVFNDYVGPGALMRSYHVSISRYDDAGVHTGVSNWRRNPGLHLMAQGEDLCRTIAKNYHIRIEKNGPSCALFVDGNPGPSFIDPNTLPDKIPSEGKIGFRAIGSNVIADISNFKVIKL